MVVKYGVTMNDKHSFRDYGLIMTEKKISDPEPQTKYVEVPGRNGSIDMTETLTGNVRYKDRTIECKFATTKRVGEWSSFISSLQNEFQGQNVKLIFDDDAAFYWIGRVTLDLETSGAVASISLSATVDPYKYNITSSLDDWLWDPFDFDQDVINQTADIPVDGDKEVYIVCSQKWTNPIIISDSAMTVTFEGQTFDVAVGSQVLYDAIFKPGENVMTFHGAGTISINYVGGSL